MYEKVFNIYVTNGGVRTCYNDKSQAILAITSNVIAKLDNEDLNIRQLKEIKECLNVLNDAQEYIKINNDFIEYVAVKSEEVKQNSDKQSKGYVFSTDLPKSFHINLSSAKVDLLFEILDTYISMNKLTNDIQIELVKDLKTLLEEKEPLILGCGQITEVEYK